MQTEPQTLTEVETPLEIETQTQSQVTVPQAVLKRFWATSRDKGLSEEEARAIWKDITGKDSIKEGTALDFSKVFEALNDPNIKLKAPELLQAQQPAALEHAKTHVEQQPATTTDQTNELAETTTNAAQPTQVNIQAERIRKIAAGLDKQIEAKRNSGIHNQRLTPRRATIINRLNEEAAALELLQAKMNKVADAIEQGTLPETLAKLSQKTQFEQLDAVIRAIQYRKDPQTRKQHLKKKIFAMQICILQLTMVHLRIY